MLESLSDFKVKRKGFSLWYRPYVFLYKSVLYTFLSEKTEISLSFAFQTEVMIVYHVGAINAIVVSTNGNVISGSQDSTVRVWSLTAEERQAVYESHSSPVLCLVMSRDGGSAISGSEDKTVKVWDLKTKNCATLKGHGGKSIALMTRSYP